MFSNTVIKVGTRGPFQQIIFIIICQSIYYSLLPLWNFLSFFLCQMFEVSCCGEKVDVMQSGIALQIIQIQNFVVNLEEQYLTFSLPIIWFLTSFSFFSSKASLHYHPKAMDRVIQVGISILLGFIVSAFVKGILMGSLKHSC